MARKTALEIRHVPFEDLAAFGPVLEADYAFERVEAGTDDLTLLDPLAPDLMVVLGGPISVYEEDRYPFLTAEIDLIRRRVTSDKPLLGICLGAQLIAKALGADVRPGPAKEIGWAPLELTEAGRAGPLRHLGTEPVLHWHGDMFDVPPGAERLAATAICPNQAFSIGRSVLAFQFHPEAQLAGFERWLIGHACEIAAAGISPVTLRADTAHYAPAAAERGERVLKERLAGLGG